MSLEQTTELYASVLRQLLPEGVYDTAEITHVADDIYAHAKALAQADIDAHRLLQVLETIPVDLLADYEREYGLPMQCMVSGSQTIEERISVLRWIRQHRNVMNREYLEQILAIFGVTLVDVVKHRPILCTAPCTSPVNTERLRYKVLLRLQYPMTADMSCIIENYLPGYLRVEWVVDMPWSEWIINPIVTVNTTGIAHYTAYKTNQNDYYDSYANLDLTEAITRSFYDADMQQWQAVNDAVFTIEPSTHHYEVDVNISKFKINKVITSVNLEEVINVLVSRLVNNPNNFTGKAYLDTLASNKKWVLGPSGYLKLKAGTFLPDPNYQWVGQGQFSNTRFNSLEEACSVWSNSKGVTYVATAPPVGCISYYLGRYDTNAPTTRINRIDPVIAPEYSAVEEAELREAISVLFNSQDEASKQLKQNLISSAYMSDEVANQLFNETISEQTFFEIAQQLILNTQSLSQGISLFAEVYLEDIANSIFRLDTAQQFVRMADISSQIELNKTLRT